MSVEIDPEVEQIYSDYVQAAKDLGKGSLRVVAPYLILGAIFLCGGLSSIFWAGYRTMGNLMFWGVVLSLGIEVVGIIIQGRWLKQEVARITRQKPGFDEFYKMYRKRGWLMGSLTGSKYEQFLTIIGRDIPQQTDQA